MKFKKIAGIIIIVISIIFIIGFISTGFKEITNVYLLNYVVSDDGKSMNIEVTVDTTIGYTRTVKVKQKENKKYIKFYSTFGVISGFGAKENFKIELDEYCDEIYFYTENEEYRLVLQKNNETKQWEEPKQYNR